MIFPEKKWVSSTPQEQGINPHILNNALKILEKYCGKDQTKQCLVIRNGYIVYDGGESNNAHSVWSCTKSLSSMILGLLIEQKKCGLQDRAAQYEPILQEMYPDVLLRHFASMTSGYQAKPPRRYPNLKQDWSDDCYNPDIPLFAPGSAFCYWDNAQNMFGKVLTNIAQTSLYHFAKKYITDPLDMGNFSWEADTKTQTDIPINFGGTGLIVNAYQLARLGHLFLNKGLWRKTQVIPQWWVNLSTSPQAPASLPLAQTERTDMDGSGIYGFNWWLNTINRHGEMNMPDSPFLYYASGLNNNMCFVIPSWNMVFVRMGLDPNPPEGKAVIYNKFFAELRQGIQSDS